MSEQFRLFSLIIMLARASKGQWNDTGRVFIPLDFVTDKPASEFETGESAISQTLRENPISAIRFQHPRPQSERCRCSNFSARLYQIAFGRPAVADQARRQRHPKNFRARQGILISQLEHACIVEMLDLGRALCPEISVFRAWHFQGEQLESVAAQPRLSATILETFISGLHPLYNWTAF